jgi:hypothetical protein
VAAFAERTYGHEMRRFVLTAVLAARARTLTLWAIVAVLFAFAAPQASAYSLNAKGKTGGSIDYRGSCKYGVYGPRGVLRVGVESPTVRGANYKRGTRRETSYVRFRVEVTDAYRDYATLTSSGWSSWVRVRQNGSRTWSGLTFFNMDWRGSYGADLLVEWWNLSRTRRIGWRWHRNNSFNYYDHYGRGPYGPFSYCYRYNSPYN